MPKLVWDKVGDRSYETGLDQGVLYLPDGSAVPWNGLTSIIEKFDRDNQPVYHDGMKINELVVLGDFAATMRAITFPDEFLEFEGQGRVRHGAFAQDQMPKIFALCYRTRVGNDLEGDEAGYKIHIVYNVLAIPKDRTYASMSLSPNLLEFEWDIVAIPDETPGYRPTAHLIIDSRDFDPWLLEELETMLYGEEYGEAALLPMPELIDFIKQWYRYTITDNGDGTYTVSSSHPKAIQFSGIAEEIFTLLGIQVIYLDEDTFKIFDTYDLSDINLINIIDNGDGTWTATTQHANLIGVDPDGYFQIFNANAVRTGPDKYKLSDTKEN